MRTVALTLFAVLFWILGCDSAPPPAESIAFQEHVFQDQGGLTIQGELGRLRVPERHSQPQGSWIELAVARFPSTSPRPGTPILYFEGGPGAAGIHPDRMPLFRALRSYADVITFDQRGSGQSNPVLSCPEQMELPSDQAASRENLAGKEF